ncbi:MAG: hypothetical protein IJ141_00615 [Lachnospiraceae bacterium]|nr:hypothetical protein [Lachnospiraceae bacterium]
MPSINRIRVNNVKYNFGTQVYDDFTMRMYGRNTIYDLANGGGKSVLMLLLLQNMLPNSTLDEKQPIEKLFRAGNNNTVIHSLIEWKLDDQMDNEGYRYMTTGFCARKAKESEQESSGPKEIASVEYFNYCILYREFNKNDIINLPLVKDGERISYSGLRSYLKELEHNDMSLKVMVFDRRGEYQRYISTFGLHDSQWEIIRGINKTEGHVRTYFETNYRTTRKVVEDLLIEEIIEKAFMVKTNLEESGNESMARMLMDIKEQLTILAKKKKDISNYDYQIELIRVLTDKIDSFMNLYEEQDNYKRMLAGIFKTGEEFAKGDEAYMQSLEAKKDAKLMEKHKQREHIECLKVTRDKRILSEIKDEARGLKEKANVYKDQSRDMEADYRLKESINDYLLYLEDKKKYDECDSVIKTIRSGAAYDDELLYTYVYNIKKLIDEKNRELDEICKELSSSISSAKLEKEYHERLLNEARLSLAVRESEGKKAKEDIENISEKLSQVKLSMNNISFADYDEQLLDLEENIRNVKKRLDDISGEEDKLISDEREEKGRLFEYEQKRISLERIINDIKNREEEYEETLNKFNNISSIYGADKESRLVDVISERITNEILELADLKHDIKRSDKKMKMLKEGRLIAPSKAVRKVIDYIETRHGMTAMFGMDYLSALSFEKKEKLLSENPLLPYGILIEDFEAIKDDSNIKEIDTDGEAVFIYDMKNDLEKAFFIGENMLYVSADKEFFLGDETKDKLIFKETEKEKELKLSCEMKEKLLDAYREDRAFVVKTLNSNILEDAEKLKESEKELKEKENLIKNCEDNIRRYESEINKLKQEKEAKRKYYEELIADSNRLYTVKELSEIIESQEKVLEKSKSESERLRDEINRLVADDGSKNVDVIMLESKLQALEKKKDELANDWNNNYRNYYNPDKEYDILSLSFDEIKAKFTAMKISFDDEKKAIEDKQLLMDTLKISMERILNTIKKRGTGIEVIKKLKEDDGLFAIDDEALDAIRRNIDELDYQAKGYEEAYKNKMSEADRLSGSIDYAVENIKSAFGHFEESDASLAEVTSYLAEGERLLERLDKEAKESEAEYKRYAKEQGYMLELYKDVKRIITNNDISLEDAFTITEDKEKLRELFEDTLIKYDRSSKKLDKAKNELLRFKGNTSQALEQMSMFELAGTIREDVTIPASYTLAKELSDNLGKTIEYIKLERDRVEKSLSDMETIKENFEEQCLQRCLDVRTELDKLPKLSRIISEGEAIQVVDLSIPYVKDEFLKQKMSDYIDKVVAAADGYDNDKDRMKFIRGSLTLKKLFGVIVTDMNAIKLTLYKRERIREQSRYLKYEEAVGSTGQSQGIYIQFLVAIINYISGMYLTKNDEITTKTIFIDNPFGAAKDVYIWEPIFELLKANHVQLIVPARGVTPAITGKFDVNYILGQQMSKGKQLTVVTNYTSKVDQEEVEYQDLEYEQVSFDFI